MIKRKFLLSMKETAEDCILMTAKYKKMFLTGKSGTRKEVGSGKE